MENMKEIQNRIRSVKDTMKITNAMYMISSTKLQKAKKTLQDAEPYFYTLQNTIQRILRHVPDLENPYFDVRTHIKKGMRQVGFLVITGYKGLAGAYNQNVFKLAEEEMDKRVYTRLYVVGQQGMHYFPKKGLFIEESFHYTAQNPTIDRARKIGMTLFEQFINGELDEVYVIYTRMINSMQMVAEKKQLLPLHRENFMEDSAMSEEMRKYIREHQSKPFPMFPSPEAVMNTVIPNYLIGFIYGALVESFASEQNSRVMAMDTATRSAKDLIHDLNIKYNRARQASITQEITEIVGGARAQKGKGEK